MKRRYESECVSCDMPCTSYCPYKRIERSYCDICGESNATVDMVVENDFETICEECKEKMDKETLDYVLKQVYEWYIEDWNKTRKENNKFDGCNPASYEEFLDNEMGDDEYIDQLCSQHGCKDLEDFMRFEEIWDYYQSIL